MAQQNIPAILRIDVEPDDHATRSDKPLWQGLVALNFLVRQLRNQLPELSGEAFRANWFLRFDPEMERCYGRSDHAWVHHQSLIGKLVDLDEPLGIHVHAHRWDAEREVHFSDYADSWWTRYCLTQSAETFKQCFGTYPLRSCHGGYFLSHDLLAESERLGIRVDVTPEPGLLARTSDPSLGGYATESTTDFSLFPRNPYFPSKQGMHQPAEEGQDSHKVLLVPLTSFDYRTAMSSRPRRLLKTWLGRRRHKPMSAWKQWHSPAHYWDLVSQALDEMENPYFAMAIRTDGPDTPFYSRVADILAYLPRHPIARRLKFVDCAGSEITGMA